MPLKQGQGKGRAPQREGGASMCICPQCGYEEPHRRGVPCQERKCPKCRSSLTGER